MAPVPGVVEADRLRPSLEAPPSLVPGRERLAAVVDAAVAAELGQMAVLGIAAQPDPDPDPVRLVYVRARPSMSFATWILSMYIAST